MALQAIKERARQEAERTRAEVVSLSRKIYEHPELSNQEFQASRWCADVLAGAGFEIEWVEGVETAFVATLHGSGPGPTVGFLAEYDALPGVGHGCGHNLIAGSAVGAGLALVPLMRELPGTIKVFGCPAEEVGAGKPAMLEAGVFDSTDVGLTFHAWHSTAIMTQCNGIRSFDFVFHGKASHAATDPWVGASALDGVLLTYQNLNALRQFLRDGVRVHGIITHGGDAHNVIPERASCRISTRAVDPAELDRVVNRVLDCARAGALASATQLEIIPGPALDPVCYNEPLARLHTANLEALGETVGDWPALASTDFGNVSQRFPAILFSVATWPKSVAFHTDEARIAAGEPRAYDAMMIGATSMAMTAVDLLTQPDVLQELKAAHTGRYRSEGR